MEEVKKKKSKLPVILISLLVLLLIAGGAVWYFMNNAEDMEEYAVTFDETVNDIEESVYQIEGMLSDYSIVWNKTIDNGGDFNKAITKRQELNREQGKFEDVIDARQEIREKMKELKEAPKDYQDAYDSLNELFKVYNKLQSQAMQPTGTLVSFNENKNDLIIEFESLLGTIELEKP